MKMKGSLGFLLVLLATSCHSVNRSNAERSYTYHRDTVVNLCFCEVLTKTPAGNYSVSSTLVPCEKIFADKMQKDTFAVDNMTDFEFMIISLNPNIKVIEYREEGGYPSKGGEKTINALFQVMKE